jgi:hypothetical protein
MKRITNDAREDEMEENLNMVGDIVGDLRQQVWWISIMARVLTLLLVLVRVG